MPIRTVMRDPLLHIFDAVLPARVALVLAVAGAGVTAVVVATTLVPSGPLVPTWVSWPLFLGIFPVHFRTVRKLLLERSDLKMQVLSAPKQLRIPLAALVACAFAL